MLATGFAARPAPPAGPAPGGLAIAGHPARPPRVLVVHNRYQIRGGEDAVVERESAALARAGVETEVVLVSNDDIRSPLDRLRVAAEAAHAGRGIATVLAAVDRFRPDVVHLHNTFPLISPGVHRVVRATGAATVQTLHNYRVTCANAQLARDGRPCEDCVTGSPYNAVLHGCYRGSRIGSLAVARMIDVHRRSGTWTEAVDRFVALTPFAKSRFVAAGLPADRIAVKPNGLPDPGRPPGGARSGILYVGRLSPEKGVLVLGAAARLARVPVAMLGDGPLAAELARLGGPSLLGAGDRGVVATAMAGALALVVPSLWYEGLPMVIAEAFAAGTPVIASRIGALADIVEDGVTGLLVRPGDAADLARAADWLADHPIDAARMGTAARAVFEERWSEEITTASLLSIYAEATSSRSGGLPHGA